MRRRVGMMCICCPDHHDMPTSSKIGEDSPVATRRVGDGQGLGYSSDSELGQVLAAVTTSLLGQTRRRG